jgi:hypothetical protein
MDTTVSAVPAAPVAVARDATDSLGDWTGDAIGVGNAEAAGVVMADCEVDAARGAESGPSRDAGCRPNALGNWKCSFLPSSDTRPTTPSKP